MGQLFKDGGLTMPNSQLQTAGGPSFVGSPSQVLSKANAGLPSADSMMGPDVLNPSQQTPKLPFIGQPSFQQAATAGAQPGGVNAMSPGLNKAGKLVTLLSSGLQGALAGRAAQEQATVASGGRRSGGAGMAFEAGYNLPAQRQQIQQGLAQQRAQTELTESQSELVDTPYGKMPPALAKVIFGKSIEAQGKQAVQAQKSETAENVAQTNKRFMSVPGVGVLDTQAPGGKPTLIPGSGQGITLNEEHLKDYNLPPEFLGKQMTLQQLAGLERAQNQQETTVQGAAGPALVNKKTGQTRSLKLGSPGVASAMARPVQASTDPNNPGAQQYMTAGNAIKTGAAAPGSAPVQAAKATLKSATSGDIAKQSTAFQTAMQHADLLTAAIKALNNGDQQTLNALSNRFKNEFGGTGPVTAKTIAGAYTREVTKMLSAGHLTDSEIGEVGSTLNVNRQAPAQSLGVIDAYKNLAQSKMNILKQQTQRGMKGQANFPQQGGNEIHYKIVNGALVPQ